MRVLRVTRVGREEACGACGGTIPKGELAFLMVEYAKVPHRPEAWRVEQVSCFHHSFRFKPEEVELWEKEDFRERICLKR